jgi:Fe2+ transport system protein FeoA
VLRAYFTDLLGIDKSTAEQAACQLEHGIPSIVVDRLAGFHRFIKALPEEHRQCVMDFAQHGDQGTNTADTVAGQTSVANLKVGRQGVITAIRGGNSVCRRLADMGLGRGALIEIEGIAPMGSPIRVRIRGYRLALRRKEAESILVIQE